MRRITLGMGAGLVAVALLVVVPLAVADDASDVADADGLLLSGQTGELIASLQSVLAESGHSPGPVDGIFGEMTEAAVRDFQASNGLIVDGIVGAQTKAAIRQMSGGGGGGGGGESPPPSTGSGTLSVGSSGPSVVALQQELTRARLYRGPIDGQFGPGTASAVVAFHKVRGLDRTETWNASDWDRISGWSPSSPGYGGAGYRVEIDLGRQVLFVIRDGRVAAVMPVSSGNGEAFTHSSGSTVYANTPTGDFTAFRNVDGWDISYLGELYEPWYFYGGYAVHGSNFVPPYPASHGCVRLSIADAEWLDARMFIGMPVHVRN
jgi:peptidoglycan hydrolase-like protein with peptidoglycan-binding domain